MQFSSFFKLCFCPFTSFMNDHISPNIHMDLLIFIINIRQNNFEYCFFFYYYFLFVFNRHYEKTSLCLFCYISLNSDHLLILCFNYFNMCSIKICFHHFRTNWVFHRRIYFEVRFIALHWLILINLIFLNASTCPLLFTACFLSFEIDALIQQVFNILLP